MKKNNDISIYYKSEKLFQLRCVSPAQTPPFLKKQIF